MKALGQIQGTPGPEPEDVTVPRVELIAAGSIKMSRAEFLWKKRIPIGGTTLLAGREGLGKSALMTHVAARVTHGQLDGDRYGRPGDVIVVGVEDDRSSVGVPRMVAAGADLDRIHFVVVNSDVPFALAIDLAELNLRAESLDNLLLVLVDPLDAHLGASIDTHRKAEVQRAIGALARFSQARRCAAVGIGHLNKGEARDVLTRVVGSVGFTTSVRSVIGVGEHPDEPRDRVAVLAKANMTDRMAVPALRFRVEGTTVQNGSEEIDTARIVILGEEEGIDADSIVQTANAEERTDRDSAAEWLTDLLAEGPVPYREIERLATDHGISRATLHRARKQAGVIVDRDDSARGRPSSWAFGVSSQPVSFQPQTGTRETKPKSTPTCTHTLTSHGTGIETKPRTRAEMERIIADRGLDPADPHFNEKLARGDR